jgi:hypothetical protein
MVYVLRMLMVCLSQGAAYQASKCQCLAANCTLPAGRDLIAAGLVFKAVGWLEGFNCICVTQAATNRACCFHFVNVVLAIAMGNTTTLLLKEMLFYLCIFRVPATLFPGWASQIIIDELCCNKQLG